MRYGMTILAVCGLLAGRLPAADDPFDFSSPLSTISSRRPAQFFSRTPDVAEDAEQIRLEASGEQSPYRRAARTTADEHAAETTAKSTGSAASQPAADHPPTVLFSAEMARQRAPVAERNPQEALQRFDEFLKTRDVVSAGFSETDVDAQQPRIQQVQLEESNPFDDLPSLGDLDGNKPVPELGTPPSVQQTRTLLLGEEPSPAAIPSGDRLTDPIATNPLEADMPAIEARTYTPAPNPEMKTQRPHSEHEQSLKLNNFGTVAVPAMTPARKSQLQDTDASLSAPALTTEWKLLGPLNVGQECHAELTLTNTGEADAERISLEVRFTEDVQIVGATPAPVEQQSFLGWKLPGLAGGESQKIEIAFIPVAAGALDLSAYVRHTSSRHNSYTVAEPKLELTVTGPSEVHVGEPASQMLVVKNPGTGVATNVRIEALIPPGLEHVTGQRLQMEIGSLNPGEVRSVRLVMGAVAGGDHILQVQAVADAGLVETAAAEVTVIAPSLRAGIAGPSLRYLGREAEYTVRVLNDGSAANDFVQVSQHVPEGFEFVRADRDAKFDQANHVLNWFVGRLETGESLDMKVTLRAKQAGEFVHAIRASSDLGAHADANLMTRVEGAASLVIEVSDLDDPVEVGSETAYEIKITNEGTASARDVGLTCEIPAGLKFLDADGPSEHRLQDGMIGFRPVAEVPAGKSLTYHVHVQGSAPGDQRFRCRLMSASLTQPLFTEELTKFYAE